MPQDKLFQASCAAMTGLLSDEKLVIAAAKASNGESKETSQIIAKAAICYAKALIQELDNEV